MPADALPASVTATPPSPQPQPQSWARWSINGAPTIDTFIQAKYPAPKPGDPDYYFFTCWGYDQWIITHTAKPTVLNSAQDMRALRLIEHSNYLNYLMMRMLDWPETAPEVTARLAALRLPIVRTRTIVERVLLGFLPKGLCGIQLWQLDAPVPWATRREGAPETGSICYFPYRTGPFGTFLTELWPDEIEVTDQPFKDFAQLHAMRERGRTTTAGALQGLHIRLPGREGIWCVVKAAAGGRLEIVAAQEQFRKGHRTYKKVPGAAREAVVLSQDQVANILVLEWLQEQEQEGAQ